MKISIHSEILEIPLKVNFKQASFNRFKSESIWAEASCGELTGYGEGCPRTYVTGEDLASAQQWIRENLKFITDSCTDLGAMRSFVAQEEKQLDKHPAAWCALELALLDLFARQKDISVEGLLNLPEVNTKAFTYTAVLGDDEPDAFIQKIQRFNQAGFAQYKVKISGNLERDKHKFELLQKHLSKPPDSVRVDANNLWGDDVEAANTFFTALDLDFLGIEEPFDPKNFKAIERFGQFRHAATILDESVTKKVDLEEAHAVNPNIILNIKIAKAGGILRSLELVDLAKSLDIPIIVGAHVGETSVLTRAGMLLASYAGSSVLGHEGGFGEFLLEKDKVEPVLQVGKAGRIDLGKPYTYTTDAGPVTVQAPNWDKGWGLGLRKSLPVHGQ